MRQLVVGLALAVVVTGLSTAMWGRGATGPAALFGMLAIGIQLTATRLVRPALSAPFPRLVQRWGIGMGLRLAGVVVLAVALGVAPDWFQPVPSAVGYLGVLIPLLFLETQLLK